MLHSENLSYKFKENFYIFVKIHIMQLLNEFFLLFVFVGNLKIDAGNMLHNESMCYKFTSN